MSHKTSSAPSDLLRIVGIGGSAGALSALQAFFNVIPPDCGMAYVVLQHLSSERESLLDKLLASSTSMPVLVATEGMHVVADHIYILPPGCFMTIKAGALHLRHMEGHAAPHRPIDVFFASLAEEHPGKIAGVVLSGTIDDGSRGLIALKAANGVVLVQDPVSAEFDGMPKSAIKTGMADLVMATPGLARSLCNWARTGDLTAIGHSETASDETSEFERVLALVHSHAHRDLRGYKRATLTRRIERRMHLHHFKDMATYRVYLEQHPEEMSRLADDMLIGVTAFFRDKEAFDILKDNVIPAVCGVNNDDGPVRIWVAGCSTGEEAYSVAIELFEWYAQAGLPPKVQIFATDIDEAALEVARAGRYSEAELAHVAPDRLRRYFTRIGDSYKIIKPIREAIVFAAHNLIADPPFSKLDLLVCRNVLIYLSPDTQKRLITLFRFVLNKGGFLFLGSSETIGHTRNQFETISKQWRIYRSLSTPRVRRPEMPLIGSSGQQRSVVLPDLYSTGHEESGNEKVFQKILESHGPAQLVINHGNDIMYISGKTEPYLTFASGEPTRNIYQVVKPALLVALRSAINRARRTQDKTEAVAIGASQEGTPDRGIRITAVPITGNNEQRKMLLVNFESEALSSAALPLSGSGGDDWVLQQLEQELNATREDLQRTIEKMRAGNEELKASNEEAMAMNEELQSANEELESSKEELQSLNEELVTSNAMLDQKVVELEVSNTDLNNLMVSTEIATMFLDTDFRIKRFTPACTRLMHLISSDVGRPLSDIALRVDDPWLSEDGRHVLGGEPSILREVSDSEGHWFLRRVLPYRTLDERTSGVVVTFTDVTAMKKAQEDIARKARELEKQTQLLQHAHVLARDMEDRIVFWNRGAEDLYGWTQKEAIGQISHVMLKTRFPEPLAEIKSKLFKDGKWNGELVHLSRDGEPRVVASHWNLYCDDRGEPMAIVEVNNDVTEGKEFEKRFLESQSDLDFQAHHDNLTQLPNRVLFRDRLQHALTLAESGNTRMALYFMDVDRFKTINDSLGHDVGDRLLSAIAMRLRLCVGRKSTLARTGGDEFAMLVEGLDDINQASKIALDLSQSVRESFHIDEHELNVSLSIGISIFPDDSTKMEDLLKHADAAMFLAKDKGRAGYQFFTHELNQRASRYLAVETRLRRAIEQGELQQVYQPQVGMASGRIVGAEALARWTNSDLGRVSPDEFIQVAEDSGLIIPLGEWAIRAACNQISAWRQAGLQPPQIAVNVSATQYQDINFITMVERILVETEVPPHLLELELTERILQKDSNALINGMVALKRLGVHLSIDDFGTGFSSLSFLQRLPLDHLKVAREFIPMHSEDRSGLSIAQTIITLAKSLGLRSTVEGIETKMQLEPFKAWGCDQVQGYLLSHPVSSAEFAQLLKSQSIFKI